MTGRGRRAVLPPADYRTEPALAPDGLSVTVVNTAGHGITFDFTDLAVPEPMQRSLARVFAARSVRWNSHTSARTCWNRVKAFAKFCGSLEDPPDDLDGLTAAMLKRWRARHIGSSNGRATLFVMRALLQDDPRLASGPVAEELARRVPGPGPGRQSYEETEREQVVRAAQKQFRTALLRIRENTRMLERWRAGELAEGSREWRLGEVLDRLSRTGDVPRIVTPNGTKLPANPKLFSGRDAPATWGRLFLSRSELTALAVLLTDRFAWNLSGYDRMPTPTTAPSAGETTSTTYQLQVEKRRSGSGRWFSTENITDSGADSPGRLITQALEATAHGRALAARLAPGTDLLMVARTHGAGRYESADRDRPPPVGPLVFGVSSDDGKRWAAAHGIPGSPFQRVRRTTVTREGRPRQHSLATHESAYVLPDERVRRDSQEVIASGALEALAQAQTAVFEGKLANASDTAHQETATADCEDETASPWPDLAGGCGATFLLCLACPNAHVHAGHHPRLALLRQHLHGLRSVLDDSTWNARWRDALQRLEDLRENKIGPATWDRALACVTGHDRAVVQLLVKGDLAP